MRGMGVETPLLIRQRPTGSGDGSHSIRQLSQFF